jgi:hypothetical protein
MYIAHIHSWIHDMEQRGEEIILRKIFVFCVKKL